MEERKRSIPLHCEAVVERLPWLLNRSLPADEEQSVRAHVAGCSACREELERTGWHWEASRHHLAPEVLVAHVAGDHIDDLPAGEVLAHLAECKSCADERDLVAAGREAINRIPAQSPPGTGSPFSGNGWRTLALAASLSCVVVLGGWFQQQNLIQELRRDADEIGRRADMPALNVPIFELAPMEDLRGAGDPTEVFVPAEAQSVTLILLPGRVPDDIPLTVKIFAAQGTTLFSGAGLTQSPVGDFTLALPTSILKPGPMSLEIYAGEMSEPVERYEILVRLSR